MAKKGKDDFDTAALVTHGMYQYVRLPKGVRFEGDRVHIEKHRNGVILMPLVEATTPKRRKSVKP